MFAWFAEAFRPWQALAAAQLDGVIRQRNIFVDGMVYDTARLTPVEREWLTEQSVSEGAVLVVHPTGARMPMGVRKHMGHDPLRAAPGRMLRHFVLAGAGSSDLGAAAFGRGVADFLGEPVGAIVAGYGTADLMREAMGGALLFAHVNRPVAALQTARHMAAQALTGRGGSVAEPGPADFAAGAETETLIRLLTDPDRQVLTLVAHSKGALSLAFALRRIAMLRDPAPMQRMAEAQILTLGAVVPMPQGYGRVRQFLGGLDALGRANSRLTLAHDLVPGAAHHLNPGFPAHLDLGAVLEQVFTS